MKRTIDEVIPVLIGIFFLLVMVVVLASFATGHSVTTTYAPTDEYMRAVYQTMRPNPDLASYSLYKFDHPTTFVTWTLSRWVSFYQKKDPTDDPKAGTDIWVTDAASLQKFCKDFVSSHGADPEKLALRLEQRLGLPPNSPNDTFVELMVDPKEKGKLFRPCGDLSSKLDDGTCLPPKDLPREPAVWNPDDASAKSSTQQEWILRKYYSSFASSTPFPWTSLGYTFDWARADDGSNEFVGRGQSEFVIPKGDPIHFVAASATLAFCTPD